MLHLDKEANNYSWPIEFSYDMPGWTDVMEILGGKQGLLV